MLVAVLLFSLSRSRPRAQSMSVSRSVDDAAPSTAWLIAALAVLKSVSDVHEAEHR